MILKRLMKKIGITLITAGLNPCLMMQSVRGLPHYVINFIKFKFKSKKSNINIFPILSDRYAPAGVVSRHYFYQDLWAAKRIFKANPLQHIDVGSRIDGFIAHLLSFREVIVIDVRKLEFYISGLEFIQGDINNLDKLEIGTVPSVSCLHALEHFGLGRYGDPISVDAHMKGLTSLSKLVDDGGTLYVSVPIGEERVEFDAHRVFRPSTIVKLAEANDLSLVSVSYIDDADQYFENIKLQDIPKLYFGCGLFEFIKKEKKLTNPERKVTCQKSA